MASFVGRLSEEEAAALRVLAAEGRVIAPDLVEHVARAIFEANSGPWELCSEHGKDACRDEAKAAIAVYESHRQKLTE